MHHGFIFNRIKGTRRIHNVAIQGDTLQGTEQDPFLGPMELVANLRGPDFEFPGSFPHGPITAARYVTQNDIVLFVFARRNLKLGGIEVGIVNNTLRILIISSSIVVITVRTPKVIPRSFDRGFQGVQPFVINVIGTHPSMNTHHLLLDRGRRRCPPRGGSGTSCCDEYEFFRDLHRFRTGGGTHIQNPQRYRSSFSDQDAVSIQCGEGL